MSFVELDRDFVSLQADQPYRAEVFESIDLLSLRGEKWPSLLEHERVVVLAEASSGKTEEFRQRTYHRIVATNALVAVEDNDGLAAVAAEVLSDPDPLGANLAPAMAMALFPAVLTIDALLQLISTSQPARQYQVEGFDRELLILYERCTSNRDRRKLIGGLAKLALAPPLSDWPRVSKRNAVLATKLAPIAKAAVAQSDSTGVVDEELLTLLRAAAHADSEQRGENPTLVEMVAARPALNQALFWADAAAETAAGKAVTTLREVSPYGLSFWRIRPADRDWLTQALKRPVPNDRLVAIDALIALAFDSGTEADAKLEELNHLVAYDPVLVSEIVKARTSRKETEVDKERRERWADSQRKKEIREEQRRQHWRKLRTAVQADTTQLYDANRLATWPGPSPLLELTRWLTTRSKDSLVGAALNWSALVPAFGSDVADAYCRGMKVLWRVTSPEAPKKSPDGQRTVKYTVILSMAGLAIEAAERPNWAEQLTKEDACRAAQHICIDDQPIPEWLGALLLAHPAIVAPLLAEEMAREWCSSEQFTPFLESATRSLPTEPLRGTLVEFLLRRPTKNSARVATASGLVRRIKLTEPERDALTSLTLDQLRVALGASDREMAVAQLKLLFQVAPERAATDLITLIETEIEAGVASVAPNLLSSFFDRHHGSVIDPATLTPRLLKRLIELAYMLPPPMPTSSASEDEQDDSLADQGIDNPRNALVSALTRLNGEEAYSTVIALSGIPVVDSISHRLREIAHEIAERSAERMPWPAKFARQLETDCLAPISTGVDLLELTCALINSINWNFAKADMSARAVVETAKDEQAVQEWLGSTLEAMSNKRFVAHREAEVASDKRPDILITATSMPVEIAVEVKHDDKGWTLKELRHALHVQLAEQYLLPANRRHGVLVITNHRDAKFWRDTDQQSKIDFGETIRLLQSEAAAIKSNSAGSIKVEVRGIDAAPGIRQVAEAKDARLSRIN